MKKLSALFVLTVLALIPSTQVLASPVTSLQKVVATGSVAPEYQSNKVCTISEALVKILQTGAGISFPHPILKQAKFTPDVPNDVVMSSLIADAARAPVQSHAGPIGGAVVAYTLAIDQRPSDLYVTDAGVVTRENQSQAAQKLEKFLDLNCD